MKIISKTKKINGLYYQGKLFEGLSSTPKILYTNSFTRPVKITPSASSDYSTGYLTTFSFKTDKFELYNVRTLKKYDYLPKHSFIYYNIVATPIDLLTLIYDGDGLFHIEGDLSSLKLYSSGKLGTSIVIGLMDENEEILLSNVSGIIEASVNSSSVSVNFTGTTATYETITTDQMQYTEDVVFPVVIKNLTSTFNHYYPVTNSTINEPVLNIPEYYIL